MGVVGHFEGGALWKVLRSLVCVCVCVCVCVDFKEVCGAYIFLFLLLGCEISCFALPNTSMMRCLGTCVKAMRPAGCRLQLQNHEPI